MEDNRYAPPKALVDGAVAGDRAGRAPALWNPDAAASWCLLFTPVFGTWLHMKNWEALGETARASSARRWFFVAVVLITLSMLTALSSLARGNLPMRLATFLFLIVWYFVAAKPQVAYIKSSFGVDYPRKGWGQPILTAIGLIVASMVVVAFLIFLGLA